MVLSRSSKHDPRALSGTLPLLDLASTRCTRFEAGGAWAFRFRGGARMKFAAVTRGRCWMVQPGAAPERLSAGDVFLLVRSPDYVLASDPALPPGDGGALGWERTDRVRHGGAETALLAGSFGLNALHERLLAEALPRFLHLPASVPAAVTLRRTLEMLDAEIAAEEAGREIVTHHLVEILLVQMLRVHASREARNLRIRGLIGALADDRIGAALELMHDAPERCWTVAGLARAAGMSRSAFARTFGERLGRPPLDYLLHYRMERAHELLAAGRTVEQVAEAVGYASPSAFGHAFRRVIGHSPKRTPR